MHIDNGKLVGTYVSDKYSEKGTVTIVLTDGDSTPTREYTRYKYVQTEQLTAIGVAVKDYGAVLVPETTIALFESGVLNADDFGIFVKFNGEYYNVALSALLESEMGVTVTFEDGGLDSYAPTTFNATLPPYNTGNAGQVPTVDENGKVGWDDIPEELPSVTGNTGKFLGVNDDATGVEWKNVPNELPTIGDSDAGKVLKVNAEHTGTEWGNVPNELPAIAAGDAGKVLKVNAGETGVEWGSAGGGGGDSHLYLQLRYYNANLEYYNYSYTGTIIIYILTPTNTEVDILQYIQGLGTSAQYPFIKGSKMITTNDASQCWMALKVSYNPSNQKYYVSFGGDTVGSTGSSFSFSGTLTATGTNNFVMQLF